MFYTRFRQHFLANTEKYLPYIYPVLMPVLTLFAFKIPVYSFADALEYWLFIGLLQLMVLALIQKILYSTTYKKPVRWLIAACVSGLVIGFYWFLACNLFHFTLQFASINRGVAVFRTLLNIPIIIALLETIKSAAERKRIHLDNIALENENAQAQFNLLLQQINPHFLFNCLTVLQALVRSKDTRTEAFLTKLADVYQQSLKTQKGMVTLREELDFFNAYMYLMDLRQEDALFVDVQVADESLSYHLPAFSLQLLAENCLKHNIVSEAKPLHIRLYQTDLKSLSISNNYQPKTVKNESFGIGLNNLKKRYALEGIVQGVRIERTETMYSITIKLF
jgi:two-component system, LytTR family, sensor kinase